MNGFTLRRLAPVLLPIVAVACATGRGRRMFPPATGSDARIALEAWKAAQDRAASLEPSRLLYEARMGRGGVAAIPGTLAVVYDGSAVLSASLTGPFGSPIAEYRDGSVRGQDRKAFVVDPEALRSVLAGVWNGRAPSVEGRDREECLLVWEGAAARAAIVFDLTERAARSLELEGTGGRLSVVYSGKPDPWPARLALRDEKTGRNLVLKRIAVEPMERGGRPGR